MPSIRHVGLIMVLGIAAFGCSRRVVVVERPAPGPSTAVTLGVPPGHLPPAGMCRIWIPGRPPGRQARARSCGGVLSAAPAGAMILYRPSENRKVIRVRYVDTKRAGVVVRIRVFEAASGRFLREEKGSRGPSR
ncbi:MAG: hypothetical protein GTN62_07615 [Gemmatimonadales bacterium]|nr:hypothetical protein [Gemmatimonadales bacterium]NIN11358.1 hypothetical protein [Gemmatimonadales bacterium]NIN49968.1 hypothetical protein [Gemmatimonadales bacterium]NIP07432.1 hypothetical protein [Gemmatimonadales bacterium]NIR00499.1 hypothetical protein [Gemmatimonadales bacterium]